ncbi:hypothetical protein [Agrobacterium tumefaciens]|uniref:hypothetical protein n=1 Tax=Agrobacterium tumefaciens TaxID=358 RepID=UPI002208B869|nr:hypothetical protein FY131_27115 [Agrobacterium tumefaciens]
MPRDMRHWFVTANGDRLLIRAAEVAGPNLAVRTLTMPGVSATVEDQIGALRKVAGVIRLPSLISFGAQE